jgi:hypothetical protein
MAACRFDPYSLRLGRKAALWGIGLVGQDARFSGGRSRVRVPHALLCWRGPVGGETVGGSRTAPTVVRRCESARRHRDYDATLHGTMAEMVYAPGPDPGVRKDVRIQPSLVPLRFGPAVGRDGRDHP